MFFPVEAGLLTDVEELFAYALDSTPAHNLVRDLLAGHPDEPVVHVAADCHLAITNVMSGLVGAFTESPHDPLDLHAELASVEPISDEEHSAYVAARAAELAALNPPPDAAPAAPVEPVAAEAPAPELAPPEPSGDSPDAAPELEVLPTDATT